MAVGIVMVNYNGSDVLALTLDSIIRARVDTPFTVCLIDNGSTQEDFVQVKDSFAAFSQRAGSSGKDQLIRSQVNLGIAEGNNLGFHTLLKDASITHICFLNTDVIVTEHWLDILMESDLDMVAPVTNANGNEQTIWVDYEAARDFSAYSKVSEFGAFRAHAYHGYEVSSHCVTTFCALIKREALDMVGDFDKQFFPGGFDDTDFCCRLLEKGGRIGIRRDCYVHHWGGGSFSKLKMDNRINISISNMKLFEKKWNTQWMGTQQFLPDSLYQDMQFWADHPLTDMRIKKLLQATYNGIRDLLKGYESYRLELDKQCYGAIPQTQSNVDDVSIPTSENYVQEKQRDFTLISHCTPPTVHEVGLSVVKTVGNLTKNSITGVKALYRGAKICYRILCAPLRRSKAYARAIAYIEQSKKDHQGTVCILAPMYTAENLTDGYFQRIFALDQYVLNDYAKLYIEHFPKTPYPYIEYKDNQHMILYGNWCDPQHVSALKMLFLRSGIVYSHSLLRCVEDVLCPLIFHWLTKDHVKFIVDMHGSIPEEAALYDNWAGAQTYGRIEEVLMSGSNGLIAVNHSMVEHFQTKYNYTTIKPSFIVMPIYLDKPVDFDIIENKLDRTDYTYPLVVYAGGLHKWQNIPLMQDVIETAGDRFRYDMLVSEPEEFTRLFGERKRPYDLKVRRLPPEKVFDVYINCHYGFILRDDIIVNNVACPTKLIEYLRFGILPVMKSDQIGDFARYDMKYISYIDFSNRKIPDAEQYQEMICHNAKVLQAFASDYAQGRAQLLQMLATKE